MQMLKYHRELIFGMRRFMRTRKRVTRFGCRAHNWSIDFVRNAYVDRRFCLCQNWFPLFTTSATATTTTTNSKRKQQRVRIDTHDDGLRQRDVYFIASFSLFAHFFFVAIHTAHTPNIAKY